MEPSQIPSQWGSIRRINASWQLELKGSWVLTSWNREDLGEQQNICSVKPTSHQDFFLWEIEGERRYNFLILFLESRHVCVWLLCYIIQCFIWPKKKIQCFYTENAERQSFQWRRQTTHDFPLAKLWGVTRAPSYSIMYTKTYQIIYYVLPNIFQVFAQDWNSIKENIITLQLLFTVEQKTLTESSF